jgi:hypothetical protein
MIGGLRAGASTSPMQDVDTKLFDLLSKPGINSRDLESILQSQALDDPRYVARFVAWVKGQNPSSDTEDSPLNLDKAKQSEIANFIADNKSILRNKLKSIAECEPTTSLERYLDASCRAHLPELCAAMLTSLRNNALDISTNLNFVRKFHEKIVAENKTHMVDINTLVTPSSSSPNPK